MKKLAFCVLAAFAVAIGSADQLPPGSYTDSGVQLPPGNYTVSAIQLPPGT